MFRESLVIELMWENKIEFEIKNEILNKDLKKYLFKII